jgi:hypothetical protein
MAQVTICIPSYRSAAFIGQTLDSVRRQTFRDYRVVVGLEPDGAAETIRATRDFLGDERFTYHVNEATLRYAGNVGALLERVGSDYFVILPHDDIWHPRYLSELMGRLGQRPDASAAFADSYLFGSASCVRTSDLPDAPLAERLMAFLLAGAEGLPWRGLTRSRVLERGGFPNNRFNGFAVECEWAMGLLLDGPVLRHPEPLYLKRQPANDDVASVSIDWRFRMPLDELAEALEHHRQQLLRLVDGAPLARGVGLLISLAAEAAALRRWVQFANGRLPMPEEQHARYRASLEKTHTVVTPDGSRIASRLQLAMSRYHAACGPHELSEPLARAAVAADPAHADAHIHLARLMLAQGRVLDALPLVTRAAALEPMANGLASLQAECARGLNDAHAISSQARS